MRDLRKKFWSPSKAFKLSELAALISAQLLDDEELIITNVSTLHDANICDVTFFHNSKYAKQLQNTKAAACILKSSDLSLMPATTKPLIVEHPYTAWAKVLDIFFPKEEVFSYVASSADIDVSASIGSNCYISSGAFVGKNVVLGNNCYISPYAYIGDQVIIGDDAFIGHGVTISHTKIGNSCVIHPGARIGQEGFGFAPNHKDAIKKIKQVGIVIIGNNVEIGSNSCIDRGSIDNTTIGDNTKIDNLVQIAHNVTIGHNCLIAAMVGIAGSTKVGNNVSIGGQAGLSGHIDIADNVTIAGGSGVIQSLSHGSIVGGYPACFIRDWHKQTIMLKKMVNKQLLDNDINS